MASACFSPGLSEDLRCPVCLGLFTDPVTVRCGHSFCRGCVSAALRLRPQCPVCRAHIQDDAPFLPSYILKSLVDETERRRRSRREYLEAEFRCPEHEESLRLYCITDRQFLCVVCVGSHCHRGHGVKLVSEAAALGKAELANSIMRISARTEALESLARSQREEMVRSERRCEQLKWMISCKFKEMYEFLRRRERELTERLASNEGADLDRMNEKLRDIEGAVAESRGRKETGTSMLQIAEPECFLKEWSEIKAVDSFCGPNDAALLVEKTGLTLGPYESHLQMFVWKEMLQLVSPREEQLLLDGAHTMLHVSQDQRCATLCPHYCKPALRLPGHSARSIRSANTFEGQHYWEVYVGKCGDWSVGLAQCYLKRTAGASKVFSLGSAPVAVQGNPQKIGLYLDCPRRELSFYDAGSMAHIHTSSLARISFPVSAYFRLGKPSHDPVVLC